MFPQREPKRPMVSEPFILQIACFMAFRYVIEALLVIVEALLVVAELLHRLALLIDVDFPPKSQRKSCTSNKKHAEFARWTAVLVSLSV